MNPAPADAESGRPWWEWACLAVVLALAAWLRLRHLGLMEFKSDEALAVRMSRDVLGGAFRTVGLTSSVGAANPPLFVDVTALPLAIWDDPRGATAFVALLAVVAVGLTYLALRPRFGALAALTAAALLATAPWAVLYGRKIWAQDLLPVVTVSLLWSLFVLLERRRSRWVAFVPLLFLLTIQLNFSALALIVPVVLVVAYRWRDVHWRAFLIGAAAGCVPLLPWLAHNAKHRFTDVVALAKEGRGHGGASTLGEGFVEAVRQTVQLTSAGGWRYITGASQAAFTHDAGLAWSLGWIAGVLAVAGFVLGFVTCAVRTVRGGRLRRAWPPVELDLDAARRAILLLWLLGIWLSYVSSTKDRVLPHYLIASYPVSFALAGVGLSDAVAAVRGRFHRMAEIAAIAVATAVVAGFVAFTLGFQRFLEHHGGTAGDYGVVYRDSSALAAAARHRGLNVDDSVLEFLATRSSTPPPGTTRFVVTRDSLRSARPLRCSAELRSFGPLEACFPRSTG